jgi:hypothetical protein
MKKIKMIAIIAIAFTMNQAFACDTYFTVGAGPYYLMPNIGVGARFDDEYGRVDCNINHSQAKELMITQLAVSRLFDLPCGIYAGPSLALSFHNVKYWGTGTESGIGFVLGRDFCDYFTEMSYHHPIKQSGLKTDMPQLKYRVGIKF